MTASGGDATRAFLPTKHGLYDPKQERDACGVGFIADLNGERIPFGPFQAPQPPGTRGAARPWAARFSCGQGSRGNPLGEGE